MPCTFYLFLALYILVSCASPFLPHGSSGIGVAAVGASSSGEGRVGEGGGEGSPTSPAGQSRNARLGGEGREGRGGRAPVGITAGVMYCYGLGEGMVHVRVGE